MPMAVDVEQARKVADAADDAGVVLMVGHVFEYHPAFLKLRARLADELGISAHM